MSNIPTERQVVREAQSVENYDPMAKQKAAAKLSRIPVKETGDRVRRSQLPQHR